MKVSPLLSLIAVLAVPAGAMDDRATYDFDAVASANKNKNNLRRAAAEKSVYIVGFNAQTTGPAARCNSLANAHGGSAVRTYANVLNGGCALELTAGAANALEQKSEVASVEADGEVTAFATIVDPTWGIERVGRCFNHDPGSYTQLDATGVEVYILDTGVNQDPRLSGYIEETSDCHFNPYGAKEYALIDGHGHGTHVAGTACGNDVGVATNCVLCAVKALQDSGSGTWSGVIDSVDHVTGRCSDPNSAPCVINMSLGGGSSSSVNAAVAGAVAAGVVVAVAAGNNSGDACNYSPASELQAITVGSTTSSDARSSFSNFGTCVDIFAPGSFIESIGGTMSGTSMASPHVAGQAAGILSRMPGATPDEVLTELLRIGESNVVNNPGTGSPNEFASTCNSSTTGTPTKAPTTPAPVPPTPFPTTPPPTPAPVPAPCNTFGFGQCPTSRCKKINVRGDKCCVEDTYTGNSCPPL